LRLESADKHYAEITEINPDAQIEVRVEKGRAFFVVENFLSRPDDFKEVLLAQAHWENKIDSTGFSRPGKSALLPLKMGDFISEYLSSIFGVDAFGIHSVYTNCMNGDMKVSERSKWPHTDGLGHNFLAANIFLSETCHGGTGFWSFDDGTKPEPYPSMHHLNTFDKNKILRLTESKVLTDWEQYDSIDEWKLDYVLEHKYNSFFVYSGMLFHNPYIPPTSYLEEDRFSFVTMLNPSESYNLIDSNPEVQQQYEKLREIFYLTIPNFR